MFNWEKCMDWPSSMENLLLGDRDAATTDNIKDKEYLERITDKII